MKSESEIRDKLNRYRAMLAGFMAAHNVDRPDTFLAIEEALQGEGLTALRLTGEMDKAIQNLPPEDRQPMKKLFEDYVQRTQSFLEDRISILEWILDESG